MDGIEEFTISSTRARIFTCIILCNRRENSMKPPFPSLSADSSSTYIVDTARLLLGGKWGGGGCGLASFMDMKFKWPNDFVLPQFHVPLGTHPPSPAAAPY